MTHERRDEITDLVFKVFAQRMKQYGNANAKVHPVAYGTMVLAVQHCSDITVEEIDHVLVQLCCRLAINLIGGEVFYTALIKPDADLDKDSIDWLYGSGRYAQG